jgi:hypothetical protein
VAEALAEPLTHILRNERPRDQAPWSRAGRKPRKGRIVITATPKKGQVVLWRMTAEDRHERFARRRSAGDDQREGAWRLDDRELIDSCSAPDSPQRR